MRRALLKVDGLEVRYPVIRGGVFQRVIGEIQAVDDVSFEILRGETLGLVGESGCGKSTVGRAVLRLLRPNAGRVLFDGADITRMDQAHLRSLRRRMQIVFQDPASSLNPRMTAAEIIAEPLLTHDLVPSPGHAAAAVDELMELCGLDVGLARRYPHEFSQGQQQRIAIARAIATRPDLIVCDEPVSALDVSIQAQILLLLRRLARERNIACLFISHDLATVRAIADRVAVMYLGRVVEVGPAEAIASWPLHPFTQVLVASTPTPDPGAPVRPSPLRGEPPSPMAPPAGCRFHPRCPVAQPTLCYTQQPVLRRLAMAQHVACHWARPQ